MLRTRSRNPRSPRCGTSPPRAAVTVVELMDPPGSVGFCRASSGLPTNLSRRRLGLKTLPRGSGVALRGVLPDGALLQRRRLRLVSFGDRDLPLIELRHPVPLEVDFHLIDQADLGAGPDRVGEELASAEPEAHVDEMEHPLREHIFGLHDRSRHLVFAEEPGALRGGWDVVERASGAAGDDVDEHGILPGQERALVGVLPPEPAVPPDETVTTAEVESPDSLEEPLKHQPGVNPPSEAERRS